MKYTVKYRKQKNESFANLEEIVKAKRGKFKGTMIFKDKIFYTYEEAEKTKKTLAIIYGEENTKITKRRR